MLELVSCDTTTNASNIITGSSQVTLKGAIGWPANSNLTDDSGRLFYFDVRGVLSTAAVTPGTLTVGLIWGSTSLGTCVISVLPSAASQIPITFTGWVQVCLTGTSGLVTAAGDLTIHGGAGTNLPFTAAFRNPGTGSTGQKSINTQTAAPLASTPIGVTVQFSSASASNIFEADLVIIQEVR